MVYVGTSPRFHDSYKPTLLNATVGVIFEGGRAHFGGGVMAAGPEAVVSMGSGCEVVQNHATIGGGVCLLGSSSFTSINTQLNNNKERTE